MPGGRPPAVHEKGARPPLVTNASSTHAVPSEQSSKNSVWKLEFLGDTEGSLIGTLRMSIDIVFEYVALLLSLAVTLNHQCVGLTVVVPEIVPVVGLSVSPNGRLFAVNVYPPEPPDAAIVAAYGTPCVAFGSDPLVVISTA